MKKTFIAHLLSLLLIVPFITYSQINEDSLAILIGRLGNNFIKEKQAIGLSIGLYTNGKTYFFNFGNTQKGKAGAPTENTIYEVGSITKTFVSYILANAVLQHKVNLDDDIRKYLKESYPNLEYKGNPIKLVHLANTTSLLPDWLPELPAAMKGLPPDSAISIKLNFYKNLTRKDFFKALHTVQLDTIPGSKRYHSNAGAQLLAYILEDVYQMPMEKLIEEMITVPLKMKSTAFIKSAKAKNLATGYTATDKEGMYEFVMPYFTYAGGLGSTANDLVSYIRHLMNKENFTAALCLQKTIDIDASSGKVVPMRPDDIAAPEVYSAALNWFKYQPAIKSSQIWADGGTNGFNSYLVMYPHVNRGIVLLANKSDEKIFRALPGIARQISQAIEKKYSKDSTFLKVHFLYGSKPLKKYKDTERKWFGGVLGGHVGIEGDSDKILNFLRKGKFHWFAKKDNRHSMYKEHAFRNFYAIFRSNPDSVKKAIVCIPVTIHQKQQFDSIATAYLQQTPYDYAFIGMRCGAAAYDILGQLAILPRYSYCKTYKKIFYPKKLRKRLLKKAKDNNWTIIRQEGSIKRKWERD